MATAKIKEVFQTAVVAFGNSGLPLGQRTPEEINQLAIIARQSKDPSLLQLFEELPALEELKREKVEAQLKKIMPDRQPVTPTVTTANTTNEKSKQQESTGTSTTNTGEKTGKH